MCPITKEKLTVIEKNGNKFLINKSKTLMYKFHNDIPILLPEECISVNRHITPDYSTFKKHKQNLEYVYKIDKKKTKFLGVGHNKLNWMSRAVHKPLAVGLKDGNVLDIGGGLGLFRNLTNGRFHLNVDVSETYLSLDPSSNKVNGRSEQIPILNETFDNVVSARSMEHCQDVPKTMSELVRCLKPNGRLVVACWREDWLQSQKYSIWAITNFLYFLRTVIAFAKTNPDLLVDRFLYKLKIKKTKSSKHVKNIWGREGHDNYYSRSFNRDVFQKMLEKAGVKIIKKGYCGIDFPYISPPRFIVDRFYDESKYGHFFFFVCKKQNSTKVNI